MEIAHFDLVSQISGGRYGAIWRAHDPRSGRDVALKQLALVAAETWDRIAEVARAAGNVQHRNVAASYEPIVDDNQIWLVEEWVDGASLAALAPPRAELTIKQALGVLHGALEGLAAIHHNRIVHGSMSPRTVMIDREGTAKLVEVAAWLANSGAPGRDAYASPELIAGAEPGMPSDVYSAGVMLDELLRQHPPTDQAAADRIQHDLQPVADRATAAEPGHRYEDAKALLAEFDRAGERAFGPLWWTTEGVGAIAAAAAGGVAASGSAVGGTGALAGSVSGAGPGGSGAVAGSISTHGGGAVPGAAAPVDGGGVLAGSVKQGTRSLSRKGLIGIVAGVVAATIVTVSAIALNRDDTVAAEPAPGGSVPAANNPTSGPTSTPTPTPSPSPTQNPIRSFQGVYIYEAVVTKSTAASQPVGSRETQAWSVKTTCQADRCSSKISTGTGGTTSLTSKGAGWNTRVRGTGQCVSVTTGRPSGQNVPNLYTRTLKPGPLVGGQLRKITGSDRLVQLKNCRNQKGKRYDVTRKITITFQG
jgi:eukaryotic-like serine/threonine-protein kinase